MKTKDTTILPLYLLFWIPMTIAVLMDIFYWIRWDIFGNTEGINPFYLQFGSMWKSDLWVINQIGVIGSILCGFIAVGYIWITVQIISALRNKS